SVKKFTEAMMTKSKTKNPTPSINVNLCPIHSAKPVSLNPSARANPPPKRIKTPQGIFSAVFQSKILPFFLESGSINRMTTPVKTIMVSSIPGIYLDRKKLLEIQAKQTKEK